MVDEKKVIKRCVTCRIQEALLPACELCEHHFCETDLAKHYKELAIKFVPEIETYCKRGCGKKWLVRQENSNTIHYCSWRCAVD